MSVTDSPPEHPDGSPHADRQFQRLLDALPIAAFTCDAAGRITYFNADAVHMWGALPSVDSRWMGPVTLRSPKTRALVLADQCCMAQVARTGDVCSEELDIQRADGTRLTVVAEARPLRNGDGDVIGAVAVLTDITQRRDAEITQARLAAIIAYSDDAIISKTLEGIIVSWNQSAERLFGFSAAEAVGQSIMLIIPDDRRDEEREILAKLVRGERIEHYETIRITRSGQLRNVSLTSSPIRDAAGHIVGASKIARDITARVANEAHLRLLHEELRQADQAKSDFLATLAHELRNPLAPIRSLVAMLGRSELPAGELPDALAVIDRQLTQMTRLIDDLMDIARISKNKFELRLDATSLAAIVETASEAIRPAMVAKEQKYIVHLPSEPVRFNADAARLTQALGNVLSNASKYTPHGGRITLSAKREGGDLAITVSDNGVGIQPDMLDQIFNMFVQGSNPRRRDASGLGLGLYLAGRLIEMHGGSIRATSDGVGMGSTFHLSIPVVAVPALPRLTRAGDAAPAARVGHRVLVVDDNRDAADALGAYLRILGYTSDAVYDGAAALERGPGFAPDVILLDIGLPGMDGYETARRIREQHWGRQVRLCALTGWGQEDARRQSKEAGFDAHFVKPIDALALMAAVERLDTDGPSGLH